MSDPTDLTDKNNCQLVRFQTAHCQFLTKEFSSRATIIYEDLGTTVRGPLLADDFDLSDAEPTVDGGPWVNKNIRTIVVGGSPASADKLDIDYQFKVYQDWLKEKLMIESQANTRTFG